MIVKLGPIYSFWVLATDSSILPVRSLNLIQTIVQRDHVISKTLLINQGYSSDI